MIEPLTGGAGTHRDQGMLGAEEDTIEVDGDHMPPFLQRCIGRERGTVDGRARAIDP